MPLISPANNIAERTTNRLFLIYEDYGAHKVVHLASAASPSDAIRTYIQEMKPEAQFEADDSLAIRDGHKVTEYPHVLAYIEAQHKPCGEWQIRELPEGACHAALTEAFCSEDPWSVAQHLDACRKLYRKEVPRVRPPGFVWYVQDGVVVTLYRKAGYGRIEVLKRYIRRRADNREYLLWQGSYEDLMENLYLGPGEQGILRP